MVPNFNAAYVSLLATIGLPIHPPDVENVTFNGLHIVYNCRELPEVCEDMCWERICAPYTVAPGIWNEDYYVHELPVWHTITPSSCTPTRCVKTQFRQGYTACYTWPLLSSSDSTLFDPLEKLAAAGVHDLCVQKVRDKVLYLPYFENIKLEGLRHTRILESSTELADSDKDKTFKYQYHMDSGDIIVMQGQTSQQTDVPRLVYSAFRSGISSREVQANLIDVYRHIDSISSDIITDRKKKMDKEEGETESGWTGRALLGKLKAYVV
ncbi:hypothetical protein MMC17_006735 [Xylographa soralifera]|nr:hypothetical protein [Xylographa soralifera]